jgi:cytidylate kinase
MDSPAATIIVMGVAGCGKTTVGTLLAQRLGVPYLEADHFHPDANVAKMRQEPRSPTRTGNRGSPRSPGRSRRAPAPGQ